MLRRRIEAPPVRDILVRRWALAFAVVLAWTAPSRADALVWPAGFVDLAAVAPGIVVQMRYAGPYNFVGRPVRGYAAPRCLLARPAAMALARVARDLARQGLGLMVYDCYRPRRAVADFVAWAGDDDVSTRERHYPAIPKTQLFGLGYIAAHSGHSRGSTVDLTLIRLPRGAVEPQVEPDDCRRGASSPGDGGVDMGTSFDCFDERAHSDYPGLSPAVRRHRGVLNKAMARRGFLPYAKEWWHFTLAAEPFPDQAFDFEIR
jgi:D-alanyl-D-alanine dipeptidase